MLPARPGKRNLAGAQKIFNAATVTVGGLYLTTHSVAVTLIGAAAGTAITGWTTGLEYSRTRTKAGSGAPVHVGGETAGTAGEATSGAHDEK